MNQKILLPLLISLFYISFTVQAQTANKLSAPFQETLNNSSLVAARIQRLLKTELPLHYLKIHIDQSQPLSEEIRSFFFDFGFDPAIEGFDILIGLSNDHNAFAFGLIKERGDDFGYTHGMVLEIGAKLKSGRHFKFKYSSDLYTKAIDGEMIPLSNGNFAIKQNITNENIARFILDNYDENRLFYWRGELGWHQLKHDPDDSNFLLGSTQQLRYHKLLNSLSPGMNMIPIHLSDDQETKEGILVGLVFGTRQMFISESRRVRLKFEEELGSEFSAATHNFYNKAEVKASLTFQKAPHKLAFEIGSGINALTHSKGVQYTSFVDLGIGRARKWRLGIRAEYYNGDLQNDSEYNLINQDLGINDPIAKIYFQYFTQ